MPINSYNRRHGILGHNNDGQLLPTRLSIINPYFAINAFKQYVRENLFNNPKESRLRSIIDDLENAHDLGAQCNTLVFVEEFKGLENQYRELKNQTDFIPFYDSLLTRIEKFSVTENVLANKKVLSFIYTAVVTKLFTLKKKRKGRIIVDLRKYFDTIEDIINRTPETMHSQTVEQYKNEYHENLIKKARIADDLIMNKIEPEINQLGEESEHQIREILDEMEKHKNNTVDSIEKLGEEREKMYRAITLRLISGILKICASLLSFAGPIGVDVKVKIIGTASVAEGLVIGSPRREVSNIPLINTTSEVISRVTDILESKPKQLTNQLQDVLANLQQLNNELLTTKQQDNYQIISKLENEIRTINNTKPQSILEIFERRQQIVNVKEKIKLFIDKQETTLRNKSKPSDGMKNVEENEDQSLKKIKQKSLRWLKKIQTIMQTVQVAYDVARQYENNQKIIEDTDDQSNIQYQLLKELDEMEDQVYDIVVPDLSQIEQTVNVIKSSTTGSSDTQLDVIEWGVRNTLKDVKSLLQIFTYKLSYELRNDLERCMDKIYEGFAILIDVYDRIDAYADSVKQAKYIAHIESPVTKNIQVTDEELKKAMSELQLMIYSNILIEKYEIAFHAFKQHYFLFVAADLQRFELPTNLQLNDTEGLRDSIINRIEDMKNYIDNHGATNDMDRYVVHKKTSFHSDNSNSSPFYVWKHQTIKNEIQQLFNGSEILVKADVFKGVDYNSVKYTDIGINFNLENKTLQNNLIAELENFSLTMRTIGNNYYRCGERYYYISVDDDITISYTLHQDESKNWINPNRVYTLIRRSHAFLSPYGMWSIKLKKINKSASWDQLNIFANETIDLELVGQGYYIEQDPEFDFQVCEKYLDKFYDIETVVQ